jgi:hypothetical protein
VSFDLPVLHLHALGTGDGFETILFTSSTWCYMVMDETLEEDRAVYFAEEDLLDEFKAFARPNSQFIYLEDGNFAVELRPNTEVRWDGGKTR